MKKRAASGKILLLPALTRKRGETILMKTGISTSCFYPMNTEIALRTLCEMGVEHTEIFINSAQELKPAFLRQIKEMLDEFGVHATALHPFSSGIEPIYFFSDYERRFLDGIELYKQYFDAAARLGAQLVVFHGDRKENSHTAEHYFERFYKLSQIAKAMGVVLAQENVERCRSRSPRFIRKMRQALPEARFVLDNKQALRSGCDLYEMLDAMGDALVHVHVSDNSPTQDCLPPGLGQLDFRRYFDALCALGYDGAIILEIYRSNFLKARDLYTSYKFLSSYMG